MHLSTAPLLAAEVPGCAQEQLDRLARSVEARRQQLEEDINAYIAHKQDELRRYESEVGPVTPHCRAFPSLPAPAPTPTLLFVLVLVLPGAVTAHARATIATVLLQQATNAA